MDLLKVLKFHPNDERPHVTIKGHIEDPYYKAYDIAHILGIKSINSVLKDYDETEKILIPQETIGGPQNTLFLTEQGLYRLINQSRKDVASSFQRWCANVIKTLRRKGKYEFSNDLPIAVEHYMSMGMSMQEAFQAKALDDRLAEIELEKKKLDESYNHRNSLANILQDLMHDVRTIKEQSIKHTVKNVCTADSSTQTESSDVSEDVKFVRDKKICRGMKVQVYDPNNIGSLITHYPSYMEAVRKMKDVTRAGIKFAAENNTIYKGYRFNLVPMDEDASIPRTIPDTDNSVFTQQKAFVAMLDIQKTKIVEVFPDQRVAADERNHKSISGINKAIHNGTISSGHYFCYWNDCSNVLKNEFLSRSKLPEPLD